jgi:hypothetical protein
VLPETGALALLEAGGQAAKDYARESLAPATRRAYQTGVDAFMESHRRNSDRKISTCSHKDPRSVDFYTEIDQRSATKVLRMVRPPRPRPISINDSDAAPIAPSSSSKR